jgi:hypothetical protein
MQIFGKLDPSEYGNVVVTLPEVQSFVFTELPN